MASWFTHAVVAGALGKAQPSFVRTPRFWVLSIVCSIVPDFDVLGFIWGIDYGHVLGHRGFLHSFSFALIVAMVTVFSGFSSVSCGSRTWWFLVIHFFLVTASHGVLDALTNGGLGVAFFSPFDHTRYFFPWTPIVVSPIGAGFFGMRGIEVIASEVLFVWIPVFLMAKALKALRKKREMMNRLESTKKGVGKI